MELFSSQIYHTLTRPKYNYKNFTISTEAWAFFVRTTQSDKLLLICKHTAVNLQNYGSVSSFNGGTFQLHRFVSFNYHYTKLHQFCKSFLLFKKNLVIKSQLKIVLYKGLGI